MSRDMNRKSGIILSLLVVLLLLGSAIQAITIKDTEEKMYYAVNRTFYRGLANISQAMEIAEESLIAAGDNEDVDREELKKICDNLVKAGKQNQEMLRDLNLYGDVYYDCSPEFLTGYLKTLDDCCDKLDNKTKEEVLAISKSVKEVCQKWNSYNWIAYGRTDYDFRNDTENIRARLVELEKMINAEIEKLEKADIF